MARKSRSPFLGIFKKTVVESDHLSGRGSGRFYSRKEFIRESGMAAIAVGFSSSLLSSCFNSSSKNSVKVGIVGAGIAGLHAGHILKKAGIEFKIFEASNRAGGRISTFKNTFDSNLTTELGGEFIDSNHADMMALVEEFGLSLYDVDADVQQNKLVKDTYFFAGKHFTEAELIKQFSEYADAIAIDVKAVVEDEDEEVISRYDAMSINEYLKSKGFDGWLYDMLVAAYTSEYGMESSEQSSLNLIYMLDPDTSSGFKIFGESDERYKIIGGNSSLTDKMYESLKEHVELEYSLAGVDEKKGGYTLRFNNGNEFECEYLILAIPFTILRKLKLNVALPDWKKQAINELGYGTGSKVILGYSDRVWRKQGYSGYLFSKDVHNGWDSSIGQNGNAGAGSYTVFLGGTTAIGINNDSVATYSEYLNSVFPDSKSMANDRVAVFNWSKSPLVLGSYSAYKVGQWGTIAGNEIKPVGNLYFAGEHCSEDFQGYMNGGAETGRVAAETLLEKLKATVMTNG